MSRTQLITFLVVSLAITAGCKKKVEVADLPTDGGPAVAVTVPQKVAPPATIARMEQNFQRVHFEFDSSTLDEESKLALAANAAIMKEHSVISLVVQGHCDERGTTDYNLALGDRRAHAVVDFMKGQGIAPSRMQTISMGEEKPLIAAQGEQAWSQNRRAEFIIVGGASDGVRGTADR